MNMNYYVFDCTLNPNEQLSAHFQAENAADTQEQ